MSQLIDPSIARQFDKLPPHAIEAEKCLIASMMLDKEVVGNVVQIVDRDAFYQADHQILFDILLKLCLQVVAWGKQSSASLGLNAPC